MGKGERPGQHMRCDRPFRNDNDCNLVEFESLENNEYSVPIWHLEII